MFGKKYFTVLTSEYINMQWKDIMCYGGEKKFEKYTAHNNYSLVIAKILKTDN